MVKLSLKLEVKQSSTGFFIEGQVCDGLQNILNVLTQGAPWLAGAFGTYSGMCWSNKVTSAAPGRLVGPSVVCVEGNEHWGPFSSQMYASMKQEDKRRKILSNQKEQSVGLGTEVMSVFASCHFSVGEPLQKCRLLWPEEPSLSLQRQQERMQQGFACHFRWWQQEEEGDGADFILSSPMCSWVNLSFLLVRDFMKPRRLCRNTACDSDSIVTPFCRHQILQTWL